MTDRRDVDFHFDFISPYSWLALMQAETFAEEHGVRWRLRPVVYAKLLDATGLTGPAEIDIKRRYTFRDVVRCAALHGRRITGPPQHPFRSLEALRTVCAFREQPQALALAAGLADVCWGEGRPLTELGVIGDVVRSVGLDPDGLVERISAPDVKHDLRTLTDQALARGVFGVPTFVFEDELFWGHDRMEHLALRLAGKIGPASESAKRMLDRPRGAERRHSPVKGGR